MKIVITVLILCVIGLGYWNLTLQNTTSTHAVAIDVLLDNAKVMQVINTSRDILILKNVREIEYGSIHTTKRLMDIGIVDQQDLDKMSDNVDLTDLLIRDFSLSISSSKEEKLNH